MKFSEKLKAIKLRKDGRGYSEILKDINVSKSTLSVWLRDIALTKKQREKLLRGRERARYAGAKAQQRKRTERMKRISEDGRKEFTALVKNPIFLVGLALYWAEGDKHRGERVKFTNSDPAMIMFMMKWFRKICKVPEEKFRIALHVHNLYVLPNVASYWSEITNVPEKQFNKIYIKQSSLRQRRNVLYGGTCGVVICNKDLFRRIVGWRRGLLEYFDIPPVAQRIERWTSNP